MAFQLTTSPTKGSPCLGESCLQLTPTVPTGARFGLSSNRLLCLQPCSLNGFEPKPWGMTSEGESSCLKPPSSIRMCGVHLAPLTGLAATLQTELATCCAASVRTKRQLCSVCYCATTSFKPPWPCFGFEQRVWDFWENRACVQTGICCLTVTAVLTAGRRMLMEHSFLEVHSGGQPKWHRFVPHSSREEPNLPFKFWNCLQRGLTKLLFYMVSATAFRMEGSAAVCWWLHLYGHNGKQKEQRQHVPACKQQEKS